MVDQLKSVNNPPPKTTISKVEMPEGKTSQGHIQGHAVKQITKDEIQNEIAQEKQCAKKATRKQILIGVVAAVAMVVGAALFITPLFLPEILLIAALVELLIVAGTGLASCGMVGVAVAPYLNLSLEHNSRIYHLKRQLAKLEEGHASPSKK